MNPVCLDAPKKPRSYAGKVRFKSDWSERTKKKERLFDSPLRSPNWRVREQKKQEPAPKVQEKQEPSSKPAALKKRTKEPRRPLNQLAASKQKN